MAGTVVAVFEDHKQAEQAAQGLLDFGVPVNDISLVSKHAGGETGAPQSEGNASEGKEENVLSKTVREVPIHDVDQPVNAVSEIAPRTMVGAVTGFLSGALLITMAITVPGIGVLLAAGPLAAMMGGAVAGGVVGGLIGGLTAGGVPEEAAKSYHDHVEHGDILVTTLASNENAEQLQDILRQHGGHELGYFSRFIDSLQSIES